MTLPSPDARGWYAIKGMPTAEGLRALRAVGHIEKLSFTEVPLLTVEHARRMARLESVGQLWLWCDVTRAAMRHVVRIPGLRELDILDIKGPGRLADVELAKSLQTLRANCHLKKEDVLSICRCSTLRELGIQNAELTPDAIESLVALEDLRVLDIEGTCFDDQMAEKLSASRCLEVLDIGATKITRAGLQHLASMRQLRSLDLWATTLTQDDLELLMQMPNLEYLSVGNYEHLPSLDATRIARLLLSLPALRRVWLDGISVTHKDKAALEAKLDSVRITSPELGNESVIDRA